MEKDSLRKEMLKKIKEYDNKEKASREIVEEVQKRRDYQESETILAFYPLKSEPNIIPILSDKRVLLPFIDEDGKMKFGRGKLEKNNLGFMEVSNKEEVKYSRAIILVPLLSYDKNNFRLGRGKGFYDRYLRENRDRLYSIGIAYKVSEVEEVPHSERDEKLDEIIAK